MSCEITHLLNNAVRSIHRPYFKQTRIPKFLRLSLIRRWDRKIDQIENNRTHVFALCNDTEAHIFHESGPKVVQNKKFD